MNSNLTTEAGPTDKAASYTEQQIDAINQVFALLRLNYHNQYYKAFSNTTDLNAIKRLWLDSLKRFEPQILLKATKHIIENDEFLPTLASLVKNCEAQQNTQVPEPHSAYLEACRAPSPKIDFRWSHPVVYHAGKKADWYFLQNNPESVAFPVFKAHYQDMINRMRQGEILTLPKAKALPTEASEPPISAQEKKERLKKLRKDLNL